MTAEVKIPYRTTILVQIVAPRDVSVDPNVPLNDAAGASSSFKVYDRSKNERFSTTVGAVAVWPVTGAGVFEVGDTVEATETDGTVTSGTVSSVDASAGTITSDTSLTVGAKAGALVRVRLGSEIVMAEYGTADLNRRDWGYQGSLLSTHPGLELDTEISIEISFKGAADNSLDQLRVVCGVVKPVEECED